MIAFRYVLRAFATRAAMCLGAGLVLYLAVDVVEQGKLYARLGVGVGEAARMSLLAAPRAVMQLLPAAALLGAFLAAGALRRRGEVEALRALGRGPGVLAGPLFAGGAVCGALALALAETVVPLSVGALEAARAGAGWFGPAGGEAGEAAIVRDGEGTLWRVRGPAAGGRSIAGATGLHVDAAGAPAWRVDLEALAWDGATWRFARGIRRALRGEEGASGVRALGPGAVALPPLEALAPAPREADALTSAALRRALAALEAQGRPSPRLATELWGRGGLFVVAMAGALAAVPFGLGARGGGGARGGRRVRRSREGGRAAGREALGAAVAAALVLWGLVATGRALGAAGAVAAPVAALLPASLALALVLAMIARSARAR